MKKNRRPYLAAILASIVGLALAGCATDSSSEVTDDSDPALVEGTSTPVEEDAAEVVTEDAGRDDESCEPLHAFPTAVPGKLTVVPYEFMPYASVDEQTGELGGIDGEVITKFADLECLELSVLQLPAASALEAVASNQADLVMGGWYITEERGEEFGQTNPVYNEYTTAVSRVDDSLTQISEFEGKQIALMQGQTWIEDFQAQFGAGNISVYQTVDSAIRDVLNGRKDVAIAGSGEASIIINKVDGLVMNVLEKDPDYPAAGVPRQVNYPHQKSNEQLRTALNDVIAQLHADGTVKSILAGFGMVDDKYQADHTAE